MEERERILEEMKQLKTTAEWYMHPEKPVTADSTTCGRNYFSRPSAPTNEEDEERELILEEMNALKTTAEWYMHPEKPVSVDSTASGRNYFTRPSAPEQEQNSEECEQILADANGLKEVASWYLQPEKPIIVDPTAFGRNYFARPSAEQATEANEEERAQALADSQELKSLANDYLHPEKPVAKSSVNCARNYFDRPSAPGHADHIHTEGYANHAGLHGDYVQHDFDFHHAEYDHHDMHHHHDCDVSQQSFHSHGDHFDMDEDLHGFRESITQFRESVVGTHDPQHIPMIKEEGDGKEGNLSRSPSSIMLFDEQAAV
jgi:predicted  nucleic acid-binding Zn-ribbon protein